MFNGDGTARAAICKAVVRAILLDPEARGDRKTDPTYGRLRHPAQFIANVLRAFDARSADGTAQSDGYLNPQSAAMGMDVFRPPSVFSYFSPCNGVPGSGGVRGPEFGLLSTSTALRRANFVNTMVFSRIAVGTNAPSGTSLDFSPLQALAGRPGAARRRAGRAAAARHDVGRDAHQHRRWPSPRWPPPTRSSARAPPCIWSLTSSQYQVER